MIYKYSLIFLRKIIVLTVPGFNHPPVHVATHFPFSIELPLFLVCVVFLNISILHLLMRVSVPISPQYSLHLDQSSQGPHEIGSRKINFIPIVNNVSLSRNLYPTIRIFCTCRKFFTSCCNIGVTSWISRSSRHKHRHAYPNYQAQGNKSKNKSIPTILFFARLLYIQIVFTLSVRIK